MTGKLIALLLVLAIALVWAYVAVVGSSPLPAPITTPTPDVGSDNDACLMAQEFVRNALKAPARAEFQPCDQAAVTQISATTWRIQSYVDAENSFGAMLRADYTVDLEYLGGERWRRVALDLDER